MPVLETSSENLIHPEYRCWQKRKKNNFFSTQKFWPRYWEQGNFLLQREYIWDTETKGLINSEGKTSANATVHAQKFFIPSTVPQTSHLLKKNAALGNCSQGIILGLYTHWHAEKRHKAIKGPMCKGNNEKAKYVLLPWGISRPQQAMREVGYLKKESTRNSI